MDPSWGIYRSFLLAHYRRRRGALQTFVIAAGIVFVIGMIQTAATRPVFEASAIIAPQKQVDTPSATASSLSEGLGSLGSFFSGGGGGTSENLVAFQQLTPTAELANALIKNKRFMQIVFPDGRVHRSWLNRVVRSAFGRATPATVQPYDLQNFVTGSFDEKKLMAPDYIQVTYANANRDAAITALQIFLITSDDILKGRERASLARQINYLSNTIRSNTDVTQLAIFRQMLEQKLSSELLLDTQPTYAFRIFDAPNAPAIQTSPNLTIMLAIVILASIIAGGLAVLARALLIEMLRAAE